jgi:hypothetical protein
VERYKIQNYNYTVETDSGAHAQLLIHLWNPYKLSNEDYSTNVYFNDAFVKRRILLEAFVNSKQ